MMKKLSNSSACVFTGKGMSFGGSLIRPEATGYGLVYFVEDMLAQRGASLAGMRVSVSGSGNVAQYAIEKAIAHGARVVTVSDSGGTVIDEAGFDEDKLAALMHVKNDCYGRVEQFAREQRLRYELDCSPWSIPVDVALPCATQNELTEEDARRLVNGNVKCVAEGSNMPCTPAAVEVFRAARVLYAPGKASNAGGVATSGLEMTQNAQRLPWEREEVDERLRMIMRDIHASCVRHGRRADGVVDYLDGANIAGFVKVADAMMAQGLY
jgi:glutamate dehydrogenase (NADP+)